MTNLETLKELMGKATKGPLDYVESLKENEYEIAPSNDVAKGDWSQEVALVFGKSNATLIVAAINSLPSLIREVKAGRHMADYLRHTLDLPETGLKKNVKEALAAYDSAVDSTDKG